ncbi:MAG: hypothetical protein Kow0031_24580 [Anaerolineae bacterium]
MLQRLFRKNQETDPIRESAALTTVYLLELNQKFEAFVREKIAQLEPVVSSLEARGGQSEEDEWGDEPNLDKNEESPISDDEPPPFPETNLMTRMPSPATDPGGDIASPAAPPGKEPGQAYQSLRSETGVGANFALNMLDEGVGADTDKLSAGWPAEKDDDKSATSNPGGEAMGDELEAETDGTDALDEEMADWERELAGGDDDEEEEEDSLPPTGPLGEFE